MNVVYERSEHLLPVASSYCPGCHHGTVEKLIVEVAQELGIADKMAVVFGIGCYTMAGFYMNVDMLPALHGRGAAVGTGFKRVRPYEPLVVLQGDGDAAAIGMAETIHAAARGENFMVIMVNNSVYGMTGGQMGPTTLLGQKTTTSPYGRSVKNSGYPMRTAEIIATLDAPRLVARTAVHTPKNVQQTRRLIKKGLEMQLDGGGYTFLEIVSACPTSWKVKPKDIVQYIDEKVLPVFPLGVFKDE
ncbi:thiamine pyrophosphate-dependent enzyme [Faecalicatena acetigenes]|uniref:Thiamine pyrophosphate-dependent enzyme n=1 Tax=Faecalicatena acetigenes TaxID=2981790 RepID=A0ABT2T809_9FIRM|nr:MULTISPECIES: thiamine pyrophosphate-dependent enzyme [Lachnospiraceae]MCU6746399.1 thiamine pyrophosphate-dependent enzyme [Faecalicatena acetigenes]SCH16306.1 Pyruvate synthase subunit porB [uncultured Clostridium sp.]